MPMLKGECTNSSKPIVDVGLMPVLPQAGSVTPVHQTPSFSVTRFRALLDTGADGTSICRHVAHSESLQRAGKRSVIGIGGPGMHWTWAANIGFFFPQEADFEGDNGQATGFFLMPYALLAVEIPDNQWFDVIVGRDILSQLDFRVFKGSFELHLSV